MGKLSSKLLLAFVDGDGGNGDGDGEEERR